MKERQSLTLKLDLVNRMWSIFPRVVHYDFSFMFRCDFFDHIPEEADHTMLRNIPRTNHFRWLDKRLTCGIMFKDGIRHLQTLSGEVISLYQILILPFAYFL